MEKVIQRIFGDDPLWICNYTRQWIYVNNVQNILRDFGWKIHVSAKIDDIENITHLVAPIIKKYGVHFKVASSSERAYDLVGWNAHRESAGKIFTLYPHDDELGYDLAYEIENSTKSFSAPSILSDTQLTKSSVVYFRFGQFKSAGHYDENGRPVFVVVGPGGEHFEDNRSTKDKQSPYWYPQTKFNEIIQSQRKNTSDIIIENRYKVEGALKQSYKGGVYRSIDLTTKEEVVVKVGRRGSREKNSRLDGYELVKHEANILDMLSSVKNVPKIIDRVQNDNYLCIIISMILGNTLFNVRNESDKPFPFEEIKRILVKIIDVVGEIHDNGIVLADLSPNNIIWKDGSAYIIDFGMSGPVGETRQSKGGTIGFSEQFLYRSESMVPDKYEYKEDIFSIGALALYLTADKGLSLDWDPITELNYHEKLVEYIDLASKDKKIPQWLKIIIKRCTSPNKLIRPTIDEIKQIIGDAKIYTDDDANISLMLTRTQIPNDQDSILKQIQTKLIDRLIISANFEVRSTLGSSIWPGQHGNDPLSVYSGASGISQAVLAFANTIPDNVRYLNFVQQLNHWMIAEHGKFKRKSSALFTGQAGLAWTLFDAGKKLKDYALINKSLDIMSMLPLMEDSYDILSGLSGLGLSLCKFWVETQERRFLDMAERIGAYLIDESKENDGKLYWVEPRLGKCYTGYAHGGAGIAHFFNVLYLCTSNSKYLGVMRGALKFVDSMQYEEDGLKFWWMNGDGSNPKGYYKNSSWCHGAAGIGSVYLRAFKTTGDDQYLLHAKLALESSVSMKWRGLYIKCHGVCSVLDYINDFRYFGVNANQDALCETTQMLRIGLVKKDNLPIYYGSSYSDFNPGLYVGYAGIAHSICRSIYDQPNIFMLDEIFASEGLGNGSYA